MSGQRRLILASASPRRRELLAQYGLAFDVEAANVDETPRTGEPPAAYVERVARDKALAGSRRHPEALVLAADTSVILGEDILGKPHDAAEAERMLSRLSARAHWVLTGVALAGGGSCEGFHLVRTQVVFRALEARQVAWYAATGEPLDKAGAYAIQGMGAFCVERVEGSVTNVIGLPLVETLELLRAAGHPLPWDAA